MSPRRDLGSVPSEESPKLDAKLMAYSAMAGAALASGSAAEAAGCNTGVQTGQVCYVDIADVVLNSDGENLLVDFDGDGDAEFEIIQFSSYSYSAYFSYRAFVRDALDATNDKALSHLAGFTSATRGPQPAYPGALLSGDTIGAGGMQAFFDNRPLGSIRAVGGPPSTIGNFQGDGDRFVGVRFQLDGATNHFGWIRVNMAADFKSITIRDYAYNTTLDTDIDAGMTTPVELQSFTIE